MTRSRMMPSFAHGSTSVASVTPGPARERNFVGHIIKVHKHERDSTKEWKWFYVLLQLQSGTRLLVELRYVRRSYYLRMGDKVSVVTKNAMPAHRLPGLHVPDDLLEMLETGSIGCICCPELYELAKFEVLTNLNPETPAIVTADYEKLMSDDGIKRQMTFKMLVEEMTLKKSERWYAFVSAIILKVDLCKMMDENRLFSAQCKCGNVITANRTGGVNRNGTNCMTCKKSIILRCSPQILAGLADETGGFCNSDRVGEEHAVLLSDLAWRKLMSVGPDIYHDMLHDTAIQDSFRSKLVATEEKLLYTRKTFVFCWNGTWGGGRFIIVDVL